VNIKEHTGRLDGPSNTPGKLEGDHAGHIFSDNSGGSPGLDNKVSMLAEVNQKEYRSLERVWEKAARDGKDVSVDVRIVYEGSNPRTKGFEVVYSVDGEVRTKSIRN